MQKYKYIQKRIQNSVKYLGRASCNTRKTLWVLENSNSKLEHLNIYMKTYVTKHMLHFKFLNNIIWHLPLNFEKLQYCLNNTYLPLALIELTILDK